MHTILNFTLVPVNSGLSLSPYIAKCAEIVLDSGLGYEFHANGTNLEGPWDQVFKTIKDCQIAVHGLGVERIYTTIQLGTRTDKEQQMESKQVSVQSKIRR